QDEQRSKESIVKAGGRDDCRQRQGPARTCTRHSEQRRLVSGYPDRSERCERHLVVSVEEEVPFALHQMRGQKRIHQAREEGRARPYAEFAQHEERRERDEREPHEEKEIEEKAAVARE